MKSNHILIFFIILLSPITALAKDIQPLLNQEVDNYVAELKGENNSDLSKVANRITGAGLSDERLFDVVEQVLLEKHQANMTFAQRDDQVISQIVNLLRTLSSSGNTKYSSTISKIMRESGNRAIRNRAKHVLTKFSFYQKRNALMQNMDGHIDTNSLHTTRLLNLLNSNDMIMQRFAAEEVVRDGTAEVAIQEWFYKAIEKDVRQPVDKLHIDTLAWYCKALGTVNKNEYKEFLSSIANDRNVHRKIRRHVKKILG
ncbi:hypothetical protein BTJ40_19920 [Microbulbifer sp. A4B17]|uniref:hypothetical protein n=1 Tax=Microbulbifer sp. A4B17 TaxID=359370 RepID=UPI000D52DA96|nr:hypothetical protein [Microbulbifer sp. A4B17]AWF82903.1 hypothetical protein BTJ40_19920 [Microbulbifer sp. A4B17]